MNGDQAVGENSVLPTVWSFRIRWLGVIHGRLVVHFDDDPLTVDDDVVLKPLVVFDRRRVVIFNDQQASGFPFVSAGIANLCLVALLQELALWSCVEEDAAVGTGLRHDLDL